MRAIPNGKKTEVRSSEDIAQVACELRKMLGIENTVAPNLAIIVEMTMTKVMPDFEFVVCPDERLGNLVDAVTLPKPPRILVRESVYRDLLHNSPRARMTIAHEIGHLVLEHGRRLHRRKPGSPRSFRSSDVRSYEREADHFAALFLMPAHIVSQFKDAKEISANCNVSRRAAEVRMAELGVSKRG
jgi:hypothetical protein